jgi:hypothetical protein
VLSGGYGFAVPAGILAGFGSFIALAEAGWLPGNGGGWFFIMLGLGFVAVYLIGLRPAIIWPFFPAAALIGFGALLEGLLAAWPLAWLAWIASYWPLVLVAVGLWLLVRDRLPANLRRPVAAVGGLALLVYGIIAVASVMAATVGPVVGPVVGPMSRIQIGWPGFDGATLTETVALSAPIGAGEHLRITNPNGRTVVRVGSGAEVRVVATKRYVSSAAVPEARLTPGASGLVLETLLPNRIPFARAGIDYAIEVPAATPVTIETASGDVDLSDLTGAVQVSTASGDVALARLSGPVTVRTVSGDQRLTDLTGEVRLASTSGDIQASGLTRLKEATSVSGDLRLTGLITEDAALKTTSGDVTLRLAPTSAARIEVTTISGSIRTSGLTLTEQSRSQRSLTSVLGVGGGLLRINTISGDVTLAAA